VKFLLSELKLSHCHVGFLCSVTSSVLMIFSFLSSFVYMTLVVIFFQHDIGSHIVSWSFTDYLISLYYLHPPQNNIVSAAL
jgi:hypothetical protein